MLHNPIGNPIYDPLGLSLVCTKPSKLAAISTGHLVQEPISKQVQPSSAYLQGWRSLSLTVHLLSLFHPGHFPNAYSLVTISCVFFSLWLQILPLHTSDKGLVPSPLFVWGSKDNNEASHQPSLFDAGQTQFSQPHPAWPQTYSSPMTTLVALCWTQFSTSRNFF